MDQLSVRNAIDRWMRTPTAALGAATLLSMMTLAGGCGAIAYEESVRHREDPAVQRKLEPYGKIYYLDGAGNLGFGQDTVPRALHAAGFRGDVEVYVWTSFTGPLGDQLIRFNARVHGQELSKRIQAYRRRYPTTPVYLIGLSAGTGVATWAVGDLPGDMHVDGMALLGSSLASNYDMTACLQRIRGDVTVYYSDRDGVLNGFIPITGTIDGQHFVEPAGLVGMRLPPRANEQTRRLYKEKIRNIGWRPAFAKYGYVGGHTDGTSFDFVRCIVAPQMIPSLTGSPLTPTHQSEEPTVEPMTEPTSPSDQAVTRVKITPTDESTPRESDEHKTRSGETIIRSSDDASDETHASQKALPESLDQREQKNSDSGPNADNESPTDEAPDAATQPAE
jgi:hypothetical protein